MNPKTTNKFLSLLLLAILSLFTVNLYAQTDRPAVLLEINGAIGPATQEYVTTGLKTAAIKNASVVILQIDTPGGLDLSMRAIIKAILSSPVPVVSWVAPSGARAASAGTYILYASHIAAMAPGTNLGAATPIQLMGNESTPSPENNKNNKEKNINNNLSTVQKKVLNDAVAYIKSLAELRHRNVAWAEQSVRSSASLPAEEALKLNVIDLIANTAPDLLKAVNGKSIQLQSGTTTLQTATSPIEKLEPNWRSRLLAVITDPSIAYVLLLIGIYGLFFEFANPGFVAPGVIGAIALILALYAFHMLPISYAGLSLILLGLIFLVAEAFVPSFGALGLGGIIAFVVGSIFLMKTDVAAYQIDWSIIIIMAVINAVFFLGIIGMAIRSRQRKIVSGKEALPNMEGIAMDDFSEQGWVLIHGERWQAITKIPVKKHQPIRVIEVKGLLLTIEPVQQGRQ